VTKRQEELLLRVDAYLDGELEQAEREEFERELARSPELRRALDARREVDQAIRSLPRAELSPQFEARFRARVARAREGGGWRERLARSVRELGWAVATPLAVAAILLLIGNPGRHDPDMQLLGDPDALELVMEEDPEFLFALDVLERWSGREVL
jgi:anti-sigma factor RsiW